jgi:hypothetical protein
MDIDDGRRCLAHDRRERILHHLPRRRHLAALRISRIDTEDQAQQCHDDARGWQYQIGKNAYWLGHPILLAA